MTKDHHPLFADTAIIAISPLASVNESIEVVFGDEQFWNADVILICPKLGVDNIV